MKLLHLETLRSEKYEFLKFKKKMSRILVDLRLKFTIRSIEI